MTHHFSFSTSFITFTMSPSPSPFSRYIVPALTLISMVLCLAGILLPQIKMTGGSSSDPQKGSFAATVTVSLKSFDAHLSQVLQNVLPKGSAREISVEGYRFSDYLDIVPEGSVHDRLQDLSNIALGAQITAYMAIAVGFISIAALCYPWQEHRFFRRANIGLSLVCFSLLSAAAITVFVFSNKAAHMQIFKPYFEKNNDSVQGKDLEGNLSVSPASGLVLISISHFFMIATIFCLFLIKNGEQVKKHAFEHLEA